MDRYPNSDHIKVYNVQHSHDSIIINNKMVVPYNALLDWHVCDTKNRKEGSAFSIWWPVNVGPFKFQNTDHYLLINNYLLGESLCEKIVEKMLRNSIRAACLLREDEVKDLMQTIDYARECPHRIKEVGIKGKESCYYQWLERHKTQILERITDE